MHITTTVVLAGGLATRLYPLTERIPKILIEVGGKPFAFHQIEQLRQNGITRVVYCVGHLGEQVRDLLGDGSQLGLRCEYSFDGPALLGTGGALRRAIPKLEGDFFVLYGDSYLPCSFAEAEAAFLQSGQPGLMTVFRNEDRWDKSNVLFDKGQIRRYDKQNRDAAMRHIDYGLGILNRRVLLRYPEGKNFDLATVYQDLLKSGELAGFEVRQRFYEIGSPAGLTELGNLLSCQP